MNRLLNEKDLEAVTELCSRAMQFDRFFRELIFEKTFGDSDFDRDLNLVDDQEGNIQGLASGVIRTRDNTPVGYVKLLAVDPDFRERGIGSQLLTELESRFKEKGCQKVRIMDSAPNYFMPGLDFRYTEGTCFLRKRGYIQDGENLNLLADLQYFLTEFDEEIEKLSKNGIEVRRAFMANKDDVLKMVVSEWPGWFSEVDATFRHDPPTLFIALRDKQPVGFSAYDSNNVRTGWFGPMGVLPSERKLGIGQIVCKLCLAEIKKQGFHTSVIPWVGPVRFYSKTCNAVNDRVFWTYEKQL